MFNRIRYWFGLDEMRAKASEGLFDNMDRAIPLRDRIMMEYNTVGLAGLTADEVAHRLGLGILTVRPRVTELFQLGKLRKTQVKRANYSGLKAVVLVSTRVPSAGFTASGLPRVYRAD